MPYVRRTKRRPSVSRRLKILVGVCAALAVVLAFAGMFIRQQEMLAENAAEAASYNPEPLAATATAEDTFTAAFLGDSWTSNGADVGVPAFTAEAFGWDAVPFGQGGTGYLNPGPAENGELPFSARADDVIASGADVVFILGGLNDRGRDYATPEAMAEASGTLYDTLASGLPEAQLVVVGPYYPGEDYPGDLLEVRDVLKAEAVERGIPFIDPLEGAWITGAPEVPGSGNAPELIENEHPTTEGQRHLADQLIEAIRGIPELDAYTS